MKKLLLFISATTLIIFFGCSQKTAGLDSAYIHANRGADGAQMTKAEAENYRRQQIIIAEEIRLENIKRHQNTDAIEEGASAVKESASAVDSATSTYEKIMSIFK